MIPNRRCWRSCYYNVFFESHSKRSSCPPNLEIITAFALKFLHHSTFLFPECQIFEVAQMLSDGVKRLVEGANSLFFFLNFWIKLFWNFFSFFFFLVCSFWPSKDWCKVQNVRSESPFRNWRETSSVESYKLGTMLEKMCTRYLLFCKPVDSTWWGG